MLLVKEKEVKVKEVEGNTFPYIDLGSEDHGRVSFRLWVSSRLVETVQRDQWGRPFESRVVRFPARAVITRTDRGTLVMRPGEGTVYNILVHCGYRGGSSLKVLSPEVVEAHGYYVYSSPRGSCGVSFGAVIQVAPDQPLKVKWERTGRLYGSPGTGITVLYPDGREEGIDLLADGLEEVEKLKDLLE